MANYMSAYRTNYFKVTDEKAYQKLFSCFSGEYLEDFSEDSKHGFGGYGGFSFCQPLLRDKRCIKEALQNGTTLYDQYNNIVTEKMLQDADSKTTAALTNDDEEETNDTLTLYTKPFIFPKDTEPVANAIRNGKQLYIGYRKTPVSPDELVTKETFKSRMVDGIDRLYIKSGTVDDNGEPVYTCIYDPIKDYLCSNVRDDDNFDEFLSEIQLLLPDGEAFVYEEVGNEKLRYLVGVAIIVTNKEIRSMSLLDYIKNQTKDMLGQNYEPIIEY